jgi:hypothetical protein
MCSESPSSFSKMIATCSRGKVKADKTPIHKHRLWEYLAYPHPKRDTVLPHLVSTGGQMAVDAVHGHVQLAAREPVQGARRVP